MVPSISITGLGLITPLGSGVDATWRALLAGEFIRDHARINVPCDTAENPRRSKSRVAVLGHVAAREAVSSAAWDSRLLADPETALIVGTSKGPIENWIEGNLAAGDLDEFGLGQLATDLARQLGHGAGPRMTVSGACASSLHALIHAVMLLRSGAARRALVVAAEASVHPLFIGSFQRLGVLPPEGHGCRPFDEDRKGFLISEAAAAVCLETESTGGAVAMIDRMAMGGDAVHITGGDPAGRVLQRLIATAAGDHPVDLFHAHATGTILNDPVELCAIESAICEGPSPNVYSHKGSLGHSLGAAGLTSIVLNCMSHRTGVIPPNIRTTRALPSRCAIISREAVHRPVRRSVAIASGFGGAMAAISLCSRD